MYIWGAHVFAFVSHAACIVCIFTYVCLSLLRDVLEVNVGKSW